MSIAAKIDSELASLIEYLKEQVNQAKTLNTDYAKGQVHAYTAALVAAEQVAYRIIKG